MKTPEKTPPSGITVSNGNSDTNAPTIKVSSETTFTSLESAANAPQLSPPAVQEGETA